MTAKEKIEALLESSADGTITAAQVTEAGLHRGVLQALVERGELYRFGRGLYVRCSAWEDDFPSCSADMGAESIQTTPRCICWAIQTAPRQSIR